MAYFEVLHELKLIVDLMYVGGIARMNYSGVRHRRIRRLPVGPARHRRRHQERMRAILRDIQDGSFTKKLVANVEGGNKEAP